MHLRWFCLVLSPVALAALLAWRQSTQADSEFSVDDCIFRFPSPRELQEKKNSSWLESIDRSWCPDETSALHVPVASFFNPWFNAKPKLPRVLLYLQTRWSSYFRQGFEKLKMVAQILPEDVTLVSARLDHFEPLPGEALYRFWSHETEQGRLMDFGKYRAILLFVEDGRIIATRFNIAQLSDDCLAREVRGLWALPRNRTTGFVLGSGGESDFWRFYREECYL